MIMSGLLLSVRKGDFVDKATGKPVRFCHLKIAQPSESQDIVGLEDTKIKLPFDSFETFRNLANPLIGKSVEVDCDISIRGKFVSLTAVGLRASSR